MRIVATFALAISVSMATILPAPAQQSSSCGAPPIVDGGGVKVEIDSKASFLKTFVGDVALKGQVDVAKKDVLQLYPNADQLRLKEYFLYVVCLQIMNDTKLGTLEKIKAFHDASDVVFPPKSEYQGNERDDIQHLMDFICNRGVLQNDYSWELTDKVYASVNQIEDELGNTLRKLTTDSAARSPIQTMQIASRLLLQDPEVFPNGAGASARPVNGALRDAIHKYRAVFSENTAQLVQTFALKGTCNLSAGLNPVPSK
jgi:hypothetical protein